MCILFFALSPPAVGTTKYKFILGSNRDEFYDRPTQELCRWDEYPDILGSYDLVKKGPRSGTWLGLNSDNGKFGTLTNYRIPHSDQVFEKKRVGRGALVTDFLTSSKSPTEHTADFELKKASYRTGNLIVGDLAPSKPCLIYSTNGEEHDVIQLDEGVHSLSNKTLDYPWQKQVSGKDSFSEVIKEYSEPQQLTQEIVKVMSDDTTYQHDPSIDSLDWGDDWKIPSSSIFVTNKPINYGTRTISVILVEEDGTGWYYEQYLKEPIKTTEFVWENKFINFHLNTK